MTIKGRASCGGQVELRHETCQKKKKINEERMENLQSLLSKWGRECGQVQFWMNPSLRLCEVSGSQTRMHVGCLEKHPCLGSSPRDSVYWMRGQSGRGFLKAWPQVILMHSKVWAPQTPETTDQRCSLPWPWPWVYCKLGDHGELRARAPEVSLPEGVWLSDPEAKWKTGSVLCVSWETSCGLGNVLEVRS